jgi:formylmethanofuran dehydrogenase subunit C
VKKVLLHGPNGLYVHGTLSSDGGLTLNSSRGHYSGRADADGRVVIHGPDGSYHGPVDRSGEIKLSGPGGVFLHGKVADQ